MLDQIKKAMKNNIVIEVDYICKTKKNEVTFLEPKGITEEQLEELNKKSLGFHGYAVAVERVKNNV